MNRLIILTFLITLSFVISKRQRRSEILSKEEVEKRGIVWRGNSSDSHERLQAPLELPAILILSPKADSAPCAQQDPQY